MILEERIEFRSIFSLYHISYKMQPGKDIINELDARSLIVFLIDSLDSKMSRVINGCVTIILIFCPWY